MDNKLFEKLDGLNIKDIDLLLDKNIDLSLKYSARKRIEQSVKKKTGYYSENNFFTDKINNILRGTFMKRKIALAVSVATVLSLGGGTYAYAKTPVAYVSLDINPSIELGVNAFDTVLSAEAYNEDGEKVLEGTNLINTKVDDAVSTVITNAISDGYIKGDDTTATTAAAVEITVSTDKDAVADKLNESLKEVADETLEDNDVKAGVETDKVALARRDEARQLGITPGKLNLIQKLQSLDPTIKVEDYKTISVKDIQKKTKELRKMNKNDEVTTINCGTNTDTSTNENTNTSTDTTGEGTSTDTNTDNDVTNEENTKQEATLSQSSIATEKSNNSSKDKNNNGSVKKEEDSNSNTIRVENKEEKTSTAYDKKNNSNQGNSNSSKSEKRSNGNSNSQNKGKSKNN